MSEVHVLFGFVGRGPCRVLAAVPFRASSRLSSLREVAIVLFQARLLPTHSFARYRSREPGAARPGNGPGPMRTYLVRIPHRKGHSIQSNVLLASALAG